MSDFDKVVEKLRVLCAKLVSCGDLVDCITVSKAASMLEQKPRWIPVTERLPENENSVLVWEESGFAYVDNYIDGEWFIGAANCADITHWMPLPEPPKEVEDDGR